jgi:predicted pyridoxine 5'-phosphate oxidase superfamily flavin-nucleotide-binding protein
MGVWHEGEMRVQTRAGVREQAEERTGVYRVAVEPGMMGFLAQQPFLALTTVDAEGRTWISPVAGQPGMLEVPDPRAVRLRALLVESQLPLDDLRATARAGMLVIDFARRIRVRINGEAGVEPEGDVVVRIRQLYGNCSKYIQRRTVVAPAGAARQAPPQIFTELGETQQEMIRKADTFFLGSVDPASGADASHRGGLPGFVRVIGRSHLAFPDYSGNNMFNTLGNVEVNPSVGLLFFDFASGRTLQLTGRASTDWSEMRASEFAGAHRVIDVEIGEVREFSQTTSLRYRFEAFSSLLTEEG